MGIPQRLGTIPLAIFTDASNNIGIGGSPSGSYKFQVTGTGNFTGALRTASTFTSGDTIQLGLTSTDGGFWTWGGSNSYLVAATGKALNLNPNGVSGNVGIVIATSGNVGIGTGSPSNILHTYATLPRVIADTSTRFAVFNLYYQGAEKGALVLDNQNKLITLEANGDNTYETRFVTGGSERMRITSGGDVCVRTTSSSYAASGRGNITIGGSAGVSAILATQIGGTARGYFYCNPDDLYIDNYTGTGAVVVFNGTGGVQLTRNATAWSSYSDERLKNINSDIDSALNKILTLRAVNFSWKTDLENKENFGLIAQDVEKVFPQVIDKSKLPSKPTEEQNDETEYLSVKYTELIPVLVKAIQELSAKVSALENKS
jgi:hypothetical protein